MAAALTTQQQSVYILCLPEDSISLLPYLLQNPGQSRHTTKQIEGDDSPEVQFHQTMGAFIYDKPHRSQN